MSPSSPTKHRELSGKHSKQKGKEKDRKRKRHHDDSSPKLSKKMRTSSSITSETAPSPYHMVTTSLYLAISPKYSYWPVTANTNAEQSPLVGIRKDHLDPLLMSYFDPVEGVVLGYDNIRFDSDKAKIVAECPFARVWVTVNLLVWRPKTGMVLKGWVNMSSASHVGLLVENTWNVAIGREKIPEEWNWREGEGHGEEGMEVDGKKTTSSGYWVDGDGEKVGGLREFKVDGVKAMGYMVSMEGSLLDIGKGKREKKRKGKKHRRDT